MSNWLAIAIALWLPASVLAGLVLGRMIPDADRDCDGEQTDREPISERSRGGFNSFHVELDK